MNLPIYSFRQTSLYEYEFVSIGKYGGIPKMVQYHQMTTSWKLYNLAFGDLDKENGSLNDLTVSNNDDKQKVLATVAATVVDFISKNPGALIYAEGSTRSRTRLYQMGIAAFLHEVEHLFYINGMIDNAWEPFKPGRNYEAFLLTCK